MAIEQHPDHLAPSTATVDGEPVSRRGLARLRPRLPHRNPPQVGEGWDRIEQRFSWAALGLFLGLWVATGAVGAGVLALVMALGR